MAIRRRAVVLTPLPAQARRLQGERAGLATRAAANVVDFAVTMGLLAGVYVGASAARFLLWPRGFRFPEPSLLLTVLLGSLLAAGYYALAWMLSGRTYGDHVLGLRVADRTGRRLRPLRAVLRAVACVLCPVGLLWVGISRHNLSLQDVLVRTSVVYDWSRPQAVTGRRARAGPR